MKRISRPVLASLGSSALLMGLVISGYALQAKSETALPRASGGQLVDPSTDVCAGPNGPSIAFKIDLMARDFVQPAVGASIANATTALMVQERTTP
jgi:hypothetical protein